MAWWRPSARIRSVSIATIVTAAHVVLAAILLSQKLEPMALPTPEVLDIELAELEPEIEVPAEPTLPLPDQNPVIAEEIPAPAPPPAEPSPPPPSDQVPSPEPGPVETLTQTVLTQLDEAPSGLATPAGGSAAAAPRTDETSGDAVTPAQVASALEKMHCLKLKRHEEGACQPTDPFTAAMANAERAIPEERLFGDPRYVAKSVSDKLFEREAAERFHWPDADLFADPMGEGAYNARRIRNGQEPLWSQEMRDGFRKSDD